jgi:hypothetical protein
MIKQHHALMHYKGKEYSMTISHRNELSKDVIVKLLHFLQEKGLAPDSI